MKFSSVLLLTILLSATVLTVASKAESKKTSAKKGAVHKKKSVAKKSVKAHKVAHKAHKKTAKKVVKRKVSKKTAPKKKVVKRKVAKKSAPKKRVVKRKAAPKKRVVKKRVVKRKTAPKKRVVKRKAAPKKRVVKKRVAKKTAPKKKVVRRKVAPKKRVVKKRVVKRKVAPKKRVVKKAKAAKTTLKQGKNMKKEGGNWAFFDDMLHNYMHEFESVYKNHKSNHNVKYFKPVSIAKFKDALFEHFTHLTGKKIKCDAKCREAYIRKWVSSKPRRNTMVYMKIMAHIKDGNDSKTVKLNDSFDMKPDTGKGKVAKKAHKKVVKHVKKKLTRMQFAKDMTKAILLRSKEQDSHKWISVTGLLKLRGGKNVRFYQNLFRVDGSIDKKINIVRSELVIPYKHTKDEFELVQSADNTLGWHFDNWHNDVFEGNVKKAEVLALNKKLFTESLMSIGKKRGYNKSVHLGITVGKTKKQIRKLQVVAAAAAVASTAKTASMLDKLVEGINKTCDSAIKIKDAFNTTHSKELKDKFTPQGFTAYSGANETRITKGLKEKFWPKMKTILTRDVQGNTKMLTKFNDAMDMIEMADENKWNQSSHRFDKGKTGIMNTYTVNGNHDTPAKVYNLVVTKVESSFKFAPDYYTYHTKLSVVGGLFKNDEEYIEEKPKDLTMDDLKALENFTNLAYYDSLTTRMEGINKIDAASILPGPKKVAPKAAAPKKAAPAKAAPAKAAPKKTKL